MERSIRTDFYSSSRNVQLNLRPFSRPRDHTNFFTEAEKASKKATLLKKTTTKKKDRAKKYYVEKKLTKEKKIAFKKKVVKKTVKKCAPKKKSNKQTAKDNDVLKCLNQKQT